MIDSLGERLAWDGIDYAQALQLLTDGELGDWSAAAAWTEILTETLNLDETLNHEAATLSIQAAMQPFLLVAQKRLCQDAGAKLVWLGPVGAASAQVFVTATVEHPT
ncbi:MAG: hypothetical protein U0175_35025 [Caldilineaceae bacterium]